MRIGLVVNPIAGLGGAVGLKGTDGPDTVAEALRRGAVAHAGERARGAMRILADRVPGTEITAAPGDLGADWLEGLDLRIRRLDLAYKSGTARDTRDAVAAMHATELVVFAGGDGTARDILSRIAPDQAILGIPCGVKMHSGVFAVSPSAAGALLADLLATPDRIVWDDSTEVMDIDEAALRAGRIAPKLYGHARTPLARNRIQASKGGPRQDWSAALKGAAAEVAEGMDPEILYIVGPGTSAGTVAAAIGAAPSILGIDAILGGKLVARDATAAELEALAEGRAIRLVLGVTGQQGFLLGRGNQQISPTLTRKAGRDGLIVLATENKLAALSQPKLWIDTGDAELDADLSGFVRVRTARGREMMMRIGAS